MELISDCQRSQCRPQRGRSICESITIEEYGLVKCKTLARKIDAATELAIRVGRRGGKILRCANADESKCRYEQTEAWAFPAVTTVAKSEQGLRLRGANFFTEGYAARVSYCGIQADVTEIDSSTQVRANWTKGLPPCQDPAKPSLDFESRTSGISHSSRVKPSLANIQPVSNSLPEYTCSFAGGCLYDVEMQGLSSLLRGDPSNNYISVCGRKCLYADDTSTTDRAHCHLPPLSTTFSNAAFAIQQPHLLKPSHISSSNSHAIESHLLDGDLMTAYEDYVDECEVEFEFD